MATTTAVSSSSRSLLSLYNPTRKTHPPIYSFEPIFAPKPNRTISLFTRSKISHKEVTAPKRGNRVLVFCSLVDDNSGKNHESGLSNSDSGTTIDIKLPRRSLLVEFTCNDCGGRTKRLINRLAYERGLVFVQCAGCLRHHKLVDNLGLIVEYDFREEINIDPNIDPV